MKRCAQCGQLFDDAAKFCTVCGASLAESSSEDKSSSDAADTPQRKNVPNAPAEAPILPEYPATPFSNPSPSELGWLSPALASQDSSEHPEEHGETPPAPDGDSQGKPKQEKKKRGSPAALGFGRVLLVVLLCVGLFVCLFAAVLVYDFRDSVSEEQLRGMLSEMRISSIKASDFVAGAEQNQRLSDWLGQTLTQEYAGEFEATGSEMEVFLEESTIMDFLAEKTADFFTDLKTGSLDAKVNRRDISQLLRENNDLFSEEFGLNMNGEQLEQLARWVDETGALESASTQALRYDHPFLYYFLRFMVSWYAVGLFLLLAVLCFWGIVRAGRGVLRALTGTGITLTVLGALLTLCSLLAKLFPAAWETVFFGNYFFSVVFGQVLFSHIVLPGLALLALGVLLLILAGTIRSARAKKQAKAAEKN